MAIKESLKLYLKSTKPDGIFICFAASFFCSFLLYKYFDEPSLLLRAILAPTLILLELLDLPFLSFLADFYWPILMPMLGIFGLMQSPFLLYTVMQVYFFYYAIEAIPQAFTAGEMLINTHVLTTWFQFSVNAFSVKCAIVFYPVLSLHGITRCASSRS